MEVAHLDQQNVMGRCIAACNECNRVCLQSIEHCLALGGQHAEPAHIAVLLTCASTCRTATELMSINSVWHPTICDLCAQVCEECADQCEDLGDIDDCVAACQSCADACRDMDGEPIDEEEDEAQETDLAISERLN
ncbi:MAG: four-helix bundle copper-binding protein [Burkholderiaceae bacterium]